MKRIIDAAELKRRIEGAPCKIQTIIFALEDGDLKPLVEYLDQDAKHALICSILWGYIEGPRSTFPNTIVVRPHPRVADDLDKELNALEVARFVAENEADGRGGKMVGIAAAMQKYGLSESRIRALCTRERLSHARQHVARLKPSLAKTTAGLTCSPDCYHSEVESGSFMMVG